MRTILTCSAVAFALAVGAPAFAADDPPAAPAPITKADCEKVKGTWDGATGKCTLAK